MEGVAGKIDSGQLRIGDFDAFGICVFVQFGANREAGIGRGRGDQMDDRAIAAQRLAAPVDSDERKQAMLDLVPLAGAGRQVANRYGKLELVGQFLKLDFPKTHTISVAAATVGGNHQPCGLGVALPSHSSATIGGSH